MPHYDSSIETTIEQMEELIQEGHPEFMHPANICLNREQLEGLVRELKDTVPEEVERYRQILKQSEHIIQEAEDKGKALLADVQAKTDQMISENEINRRAREEADEIVNEAQNVAQQIVDKARAEAEDYYRGAISYLNDHLYSLQTMLGDCMDETSRNINRFLESIGRISDNVQDNINEINGVNDPNTPVDGGDQ